MTRIQRAPTALLVSAAALLGERIGVLIFYSPSLASAAIVALGLILVVLLIWGSRVAWVLALLLGLTGLIGPVIWDEPIWVVGTSAVVLFGLLHPRSTDYVWKRRLAGKQGRSMVSGLRYALREWFWKVGAGFSVEAEGPIVTKKVIVRFAIFVGVMFLAVGGIRELHLGAGKDAEVVDVLWRIAWPVYTLAKLALLILLVAAGYSFAKDRWESRQAARH
jgi:hypothetical protein